MTFTKTEVLEFLTQEHSLKTLIEKYPQEWVQSDTELKNLLATGGGRAVLQAAKDSKAFLKRIQDSGFNPEVVKSFFPRLVRTRMMVLALKNYSLAAQTKSTGEVRLNRKNAFLLQKTLFEGNGFVRKPVSLLQWSLVWPFVSQKSFLMPLVNKKGIYCFYSRSLIRKLKVLIGERFCLEIGAGDGTLSRFLKQAHVNVHATDNHSWNSFIDYPADVEKLDAQAALKKYRPPVVISSWPDPDNVWEEAVFSTKEVQLYIVIGSSQNGVTGNQRLYEQQKNFFQEVEPQLGKLILPREQKNEVRIFRLDSC